MNKSTNKKQYIGDISPIIFKKFCIRLGSTFDMVKIFSKIKAYVSTICETLKPSDIKPPKKECEHDWRYEGCDVRGRYDSLYERNLYTCKKCGKQKYSKF